MTNDLSNGTITDFLQQEARCTQTASQQ